MSSARKALQLLSACSTTGIGSLPHTQSELALQIALHHEIPYLPQLPTGHSEELMIASALDGLPGLVFDAEGVCWIGDDKWRAGSAALSARLDQSFSSGDYTQFDPGVQACRSFRPFLFEIAARKSPFAKVQIAGPSTVRWMLRMLDGRLASEVPELDAQIFRLLLAKSLALVKAVRRAGAMPILFLDEPGLFALDLRNVHHVMAMKETEALIEAVNREGALVGLHCCSNTDWSHVLGLPFDIVSIDARLSLDAVLEHQVAWTQFLARGSTLGLGIIPTDMASEYRIDELCDSVEASLRATTPPSLSFEAMLGGMILTPACGLGMRTVSDAGRILDELRQAQGRLLRVARREI